MAQLSIDGRKHALRKDCKAFLGALPMETLARWKAEIARRVLGSPEFQRAASIFAYVSMDREPDTRILIDCALREGKRVYVPQCCGQGRMNAIRLTAWEELSPGMLGILEPREGLPALEEPLDLAIVPCVCAGKDGRRLGHGGGYYDRFLAEHPAKKVCLCFDRLISDAIPLGPHDILMDAVATENGWYIR